MRTIAQRLIPQTRRVPQGRAAVDSGKANVLTSKDVNAWCMPGGKMAVYTGLIERLNATDDELAAVMGHEIAHALREHARERIAQSDGDQRCVDRRLDRTRDIYRRARGPAPRQHRGSEPSLVLPNSRQNESEADIIGVELMARAGYDPRASLSLWQKMGQVSGGGGGRRSFCRRTRAARRGCGSCRATSTR